ncbi:hypothetical protein VTH06DRAFT_8638 [Thermothelomyces fergusii]
MELGGFENTKLGTEVYSPIRTSYQINPQTLWATSLANACAFRLFIFSDAELEQRRVGSGVLRSQRPDHDLTRGRYSRTSAAILGAFDGAESADSQTVESPRRPSLEIETANQQPPQATEGLRKHHKQLKAYYHLQPLHQFHHWPRPDPVYRRIPLPLTRGSPRIVSHAAVDSVAVVFANSARIVTT